MVSFYIKPQQSFRPAPGVIDPDSRSLYDTERFILLWHGEEEFIAKDIFPVLFSANPHRLAEQRRTVRFAIDVLHGFHGADEYGGGMLSRARHYVKAPVHPIDEIHVCAAGRSEHSRIARSFPSRGVGGQIVRAQVGFGFDDPSDFYVLFPCVYQQLSQEIRCDLLGISVVEGAGKRVHGYILVVNSAVGDRVFS